MVFVMGEVFSEKTRDPVDALADLFIRKTAPDRLHEPIVRKCLEINGQAGFVDLPGETEGHRTTISFNELVRISGHDAYPPFFLTHSSQRRFTMILTRLRGNVFGDPLDAVPDKIGLSFLIASGQIFIGFE